MFWGTLGSGCQILRCAHDKLACRQCTPAGTRLAHHYSASFKSSGKTRRRKVRMTTLGFIVPRLRSHAQSLVNRCTNAVQQVDLFQHLLCSFATHGSINALQRSSYQVGMIMSAGSIAAPDTCHILMYTTWHCSVAIGHSCRSDCVCCARVCMMSNSVANRLC